MTNVGVYFYILYDLCIIQDLFVTCAHVSIELKPLKLQYKL